MSRHTPGPWTLNKKNGRVIECNGCKISVAASTPADSPVAWANAKLISAAPEMLAVLKMVLQHGRIDDSESKMAMVAAVITKAEGNP